MPFFNPDGKLIFFVHIPKTGGSSVEDYLIRRFGRIFAYAARYRQRPSGAGFMVPINHMSAWDLDDMVPCELDLYFGVVRDPIKRMISEYGWQTGASRASKLSFSTWLRVMLFAVRVDRRVYANHIRPMSELAPERAEFFRLEDGFADMIARIDSVMGSSTPDIEVGHLKAGEKSRKPVKVSRQDIQLMNDYYGVDFERFGYERHDPDDYPSDPWAFFRGVVAVPIGWLAAMKQRRDWTR